MFYIKPDFYDKFKCIAEKCTDNCCIGWEIDIDENALEKYNAIEGGFGEELKKKIITSDDGNKCFKLCENERCALLNENNLCKLIINCGEDYLCDICREHPRFYEWFAGFTECGLGLCCEEACRLLLENEKPFSLLQESDGEEILSETKEEVAEADTYIFISAFRESLFAILFDEKKSFEEKLVKILSKTESFCNEKCKVRDYEKSLSFYKKTEPINDEWVTFIGALSDNHKEVLQSEIEFDKIKENNMLYSKILAYILYRHLSKAVFDGSIKERVEFSVEAVRFIRLCDIKTFSEKGYLTLADRINNLKNWSKQIEYSEENTDLMIYGE